MGFVCDLELWHLDISCSKYIPWGSKDHEINSLLEKTIILVGIYNQQFQGTIFLMVFDFQGIMFLINAAANCADGTSKVTLIVRHFVGAWDPQEQHLFPSPEFFSPLFLLVGAVSSWKGC